MNWAVNSTRKALQRHGLDLNYITSTQVVDEVEGTVVDTETTHVLRIYPKPIQTNQYNFPTLVGKDTVMFYLAAEGLTFTVKPSDRIEYNGGTYRVNSFQSHTAFGQTVLYKILGIKG